MGVTAKIDEMGKPAWIVLMILGFVFFWPVGLAILAYMIMSGRMGCNHYGRNNAMHDEWHAHKRKWAEKVRQRCMNHRNTGHSSGNAAFDAYKTETLKRLEDEQQEFTGFLDRLRQSKDKAEFDQFMAERRNSSDANVDDHDEDSGGAGGGDGRTPPTINY